MKVHNQSGESARLPRHVSKLTPGEASRRFYEGVQLNRTEHASGAHSGFFGTPALRRRAPIDPVTPSPEPPAPRALRPVACACNEVSVLFPRRLNPKSLGLCNANVRIGPVTVHDVRFNERGVVWPSRWVSDQQLVTVDDTERAEAERMMMEMAAELLRPSASARRNGQRRAA